MANDFRIRYSSDITPIETVTLDDGTEKTFFHSIIDGRFGGRAEKDAGSIDSNIGTGTYSLNVSGSVSLNVIESTTLTNVSLLYVEILSADGEDIPRCAVYSGGGIISEANEVGDWFLLRPDRVSGSNLIFTSGGGERICTIRYVYAIF